MLHKLVSCCGKKEKEEEQWQEAEELWQDEEQWQEEQVAAAGWLRWQLQSGVANMS